LGRATKRNNFSSADATKTFLFAKLVLSAAIVVCSLESLRARDLSPRAYVITPLHSNAVTLTYSFYDGSILLAGTPITGATGT
jgi:hypothetical protein